METTQPPDRRDRGWPITSVQDLTRDVLVVHVLLRQPQPTAWVVLRQGRFLECLDTQHEAVQYARAVARTHDVRCWVSVLDRMIDVTDDSPR